MAGKRLLDAAQLFSAGRAVGAQHWALRKKQWAVLKESSGVVKAVTSQTDRVTVTTGAAWELGKRFVGEDERWRGRGSETAKERVRDEVVRGADAGRAREEGVGVKVDEVREEVREVVDDGTLSSLRKRELQRVAERQIPAVSAGTQGTQDARAGQDTFSQRAGDVSPELSSLPRVKLPKHVADGQGSDEHVEDKGLNQDVYYTAQTEAQKEELPEGVNVDIFSSPKVSKMLGQMGGEKGASPYAGRKRAAPKPLPEMVAAMERRAQEAKAKEEAREAAETVQPAKSDEAREAVQPVQPTPARSEDSEIADLAASIATDTDAQTAIPGEEPPKAAQAPYEMRESRVPSSRFGRLWQYGGLATSMAFGAVGESFRRVTGSGTEGSLMLSEANINRLVAKLSRMRGAALKLGQIVSFQDSKVLPATINTVLQRVQDSADYMPPSQRDQVLVRNLGENWRHLFSHFEEKPFAAASIGQVHKATLASNGKAVAVKVQYPGVRDSIDSDLNNLSLLLTASRLLPKGLYLDKTIANARTELGWECDYLREASACTRFQSLVADEPSVFAVPTVYSEASGLDVLTAEFMSGTAVTKLPDLTQAERDWIGTQVLRLCLRELMEWQFMQTDPNWTNFLYNRSTKKLELLDFGASRDFPKAFVEPYVALLIAASKRDRAECARLSIELGYLTGRESQQMLDAHVDSILVLAEPFLEGQEAVYDFRDQTITDRVRANIGLMLRERLAPPPEETYSLHRKLSGAFLLCARLESRVEAREMFGDAVRVWEGREGSGKVADAA